VAKRLIGSGCRFGWQVQGVGRVMDVLDGGGDRRSGRDSFADEFGASL